MPGNSKRSTNRLRFRKCQVRGCIMPKGHRPPLTVSDNLTIVQDESTAWHRSAEGWFLLVEIGADG